MKKLLLGTALITSVNFVSASSLYNAFSTALSPISTICTKKTNSCKSVSTSIKGGYNWVKGIHADIKTNAPTAYTFVTKPSNIASGIALTVAAGAVSAAGIPFISTAVAGLTAMSVVAGFSITLTLGVIEYNTPKQVKKAAALGVAAVNKGFETAEGIVEFVHDKIVHYGGQNENDLRADGVTTRFLEVTDTSSAVLIAHQNTPFDEMNDLSGVLRENDRSEFDLVEDAAEVIADQSRQDIEQDEEFDFADDSSVSSTETVAATVQASNPTVRATPTPKAPTTDDAEWEVIRS